jgi:hypothetical protein
MNGHPSFFTILGHTNRPSIHIQWNVSEASDSESSQKLLTES